MWHKTFAGLFSGLLFFLLVPPAFSLLFPTYTTLMITLGILIFIPAWAVIMTYCYAAVSNKQAWQRSAKFAISSILFYLIIYSYINLSFGLPQ